jgi:6-phosphogluconolactonase
MDVEIVAAPLLAGRAAVWMADRAFSAVAQRGEAHLAVSGGSTPAAMFERLAALGLPWEHVHVWQVDERVAPDGDKDRNAGQLTVFSDAGAVVHLMEVTDPDLDAAAARYAAELPVVFDVVHLGLGDDGHTASWPPGDPVWTDALPGKRAHGDVAVVGPFNGRVRLTLTPAVVDRARATMLLVAGAAKAPMVRRLLAGDDTIPASRVHVGSVTLLLDDAAGA